MIKNLTRNNLTFHSKFRMKQRITGIKDKEMNRLFDYAIKNGTNVADYIGPFGQYLKATETKYKRNKIRIKVYRDKVFIYRQSCSKARTLITVLSIKEKFLPIKQFHVKYVKRGIDIMKKIDNFEEIETREAGEFKRPLSGGYKMKIVRATETKSQAGNDMLVLDLDFADGEFKDYYKQRFERNDNALEAKWGCVYRQLFGEANLPYFKGLTTAIENSNKGFKWAWDEQELVGKVIAVAMGLEEYTGNDGLIRVNLKPINIHSLDKLSEIKPPSVKLLNGSYIDFNKYDGPNNDPFKEYGDSVEIEGESKPKAF